MTGQEHHRFAEQLVEEAYNRLRHDDEPGAAAWAAVAQVHATLALASAAEQPASGPPHRAQAAHP